MVAHLKQPIPSPAVMQRIGSRFRLGVKAFADAHQIPVVRFGKDDRKQDVMAPYLARQAKTGVSGVAAIGVAQEYQNVFAASPAGHGEQVWFSFYKADRRVTCFYFYLWDVDFGPAFIKVCSYFPYPVKVWLNGAGRCGSRPSSTHPTTWAACAGCSISTSCRPRPVT